MFGRKTPAFTLPVAWLLGAVSCYAVLREHAPPDRSPSPGATIATVLPRPEPRAECPITIKSGRGFKHIRPLIYAEAGAESPSLAGLKEHVKSVLDSAHHSGILLQSAVHVLDLTSGRWFALSPEARFEPGSLMKVAVMMAMLKMVERDPKLLDEPLFLSQEPSLPQVYFPPRRRIAVGVPYRLTDLLLHTIHSSDNAANAALLEHLDPTVFADMLERLGLPAARPGDDHYPITAGDYGCLLSALYNVAYLGPEMSEFAAGILEGSEFDIGMRAAVPAGIPVIHKFGEAGGPDNPELHEGGIVLDPGHPYLLVVMTRGRAMGPLPAVIRSVTRVVHEALTAGSS